MSTISVQHDPVLEIPEIVTQLMNTSSEESGAEGNTTGTLQTKIMGIMCPIIALNGVVVDFADIVDFELDSNGRTPMCSVVFKDRNNYFTQYTAPGTSNILQVQILPPFDDAYTKINLMFYCTKFSVTNGYVSVSGQYKLLGFTDSRFKCFGEITTWDFCDAITNEIGLGFASNVASSDDMRYIYCNYQSYKDKLDAEIGNSYSSDSQVFDWWVDFWNYLVLCDIYERYNTEDSEDDMMVWISTRTDDSTIDSDEVEALETICVLNNHPSYENTELYVKSYSKVNNTYLNYYNGTSKLVSVYSESSRDYVDNIVMDGDITNDEFMRYEYAGEYYGNYNYIFAKQCRNIYLNKMNSETLNVVLTHPLLGISRGDQIRFVWYDNNRADVYQREILEENEGIPTTNELDLGWLGEYVNDTSNIDDDINPLNVNLEVSGQYTVVGQSIKFSNSAWEYILKLTRPASRKPKLLLNGEESIPEASE